MSENLEPHDALRKKPGFNYAGVDPWLDAAVDAAMAALSETEATNYGDVANPEIAIGRMINLRALLKVALAAADEVE